LSNYFFIFKCFVGRKRFSGSVEPVEPVEQEQHLAHALSVRRQYLPKGKIVVTDQDFRIGPD
jgi:hypothetical protein